MGLNEEVKLGVNKNGADTLNTTGSYLLDFFAKAGAIRNYSVEDKCELFEKAFKEDPLSAVILLFHTRNIRGGYGERDTFKQIFKYLANERPDIVEKNLWAVLEFGCAKDLYCLIDTKAEDAMWKFMGEQLAIDKTNMDAGKSISLLAKWIYLPSQHSSKSSELGKLTAKKLGYNARRMVEFKKLIKELRKYLDLPETKMSDGRWDEIEYSKCSSRFIFKNSDAFLKNDRQRWEEYLMSVDSGESTMNMCVVNPCEIFAKMVEHDTYSKSCNELMGSVLHSEMYKGIQI